MLNAADIDILPEYLSPAAVHCAGYVRKYENLTAILDGAISFNDMINLSTVDEMEQK